MNHNNNHNNNNISRKRPIENVLVLQGGGSLGAFACGVYKILHKKNIKFDIVGGTSIGGINGAIIAGSKNDNPVKDLEDFWLELAESSYTIIPDILTLDYDEGKGIGLKTIPSASLNATIYGIPKMFIPRWLQTTNISEKSLLDKQQLPWNWTYIYDNFKMQIQLKHLLASVGYPNYGFPWVEVEDGIYGWDGALLSNTPMREVILQSPSYD